jgi:DNA repair protein RecO (recombination protein O)
MSGTYKTEGIILRRRNFGEADKILTIYSKHYGKVRAIAKGIRKLKSRKAGSLELFNYCQLVLVKGRNLDIISEVQAMNAFREWRKNLTKVGVAYYFCELVDKLTPDGQANKAVFELLREFLGKIGFSSLPALVRSFEEHLLDELGFGVPFEWRKRQGSLKPYIESITEKEIHSPKILAKQEKIG